MIKKLKISDITQELTTEDSSGTILREIRERLSANNIVEIDFEDVLGITTYGAKNIFGPLFFELGPQSFADRILFKNLAEDKKIIIQQGILDYINTRRSSQKSAAVG